MLCLTRVSLDVDLVVSAAGRLPETPEILLCKNYHWPQEEDCCGPRPLSLSTIYVARHPSFPS